MRLVKNFTNHPGQQEEVGKWAGHPRTSWPGFSKIFHLHHFLPNLSTSALFFVILKPPICATFLLNAPPARNTTATPLLTGPLAFFSNRTKYYQYFLISQKAPLNDSLTWPAPYGLPKCWKWRGPALRTLIWPAPFFHHRQNFIRPRYSDCILFASITWNMNMGSFF